MDVAGWDFFEERIATLVLLENHSLPQAIGALCDAYPESSADQLLLAAISFATHLDTTSGHVEDKALAQSHRRYRVIAALAADLALLPDGKRQCEDLRLFWQASGSEVFF
ncbi:hypothetical protein Z945_1072 [Sulfitobacter noctilucae]|nr:hypothetical protein Z945_1072 [Sulfitobacter noctilucae]